MEKERVETFIRKIPVVFASVPEAVRHTSSSPADGGAARG